MDEKKEQYSEVLGVLLALGNKYVEKLPPTMMQYLMKNCEFDKIPEIDKNKRIEEQNVSEEARMFLIMLKLKYWCDSEDEKNEIIRLLKENERKYQEELSKKYNASDFFKNKNDEISEINEKETEKNSIVKYKEENFIQRIVNKIKSLFKK